MDNNKDAIRFIDRLYRDLYLSDEVLNHSTGSRTDKFRNIREYFAEQEDIHRRVSILENRKKILKKLYHDRYVIKRGVIPESYYELQKVIVLNKGMGHLVLDDNTKKKMQDEVIKNQEESLDKWIDYFLNDNKQNYPFWVKYWAFQGMLKLGTFNEDALVFNKRTKYTTVPFVSLNVDALNQSIDLIIKALNKEKIEDKELKKMVNDGSFQMLYTYFLEKERKKTKKNEGIWVKYDKGGDYRRLAESLSNTEWCTKGVGTAEAQLSLGDFYVYYTLDENDEYKVPRIAIRMEGDNIGEIRGVALRQNIEPEMQSVVDKKLIKFPDCDEYYKKSMNMDKLTEIYKKQENNIDLSTEELRFLYEIDEYIIGFGQIHDLRIEEIKEKRDTYKDLSRIFNYDVKAIEDNYICNLKNGIIMKPDDPLFPKVIVDRLPFMDNIDNMVFPDILIGSMHFGGVQSVRNTKFPKRLNSGKYGKGTGGLNIGYMRSTFENVQFPDEICGSLDFTANVANNVCLPKIVHDNARIIINSYSNLVLPEEVHGWLNLDIKSSDGITLPKIIKKAITIKSLGPTIGSLRFPDVCWSIELPDIIYGTGLVLPKMLQDDLILNKITIADNMILPETVGGDLNLSELVDGTNLVLPTNIGESLDIRSLTNINGLVLPKSIIKDLHISNVAYEYFGREALESIVGGKILIYNEEKRCISGNLRVK